MIKLFLTAFIFTLCVGLANAQKEIKRSSGNTFSLGVESFLPIGLFGQVYSYGVGASAQENFSIDKNLALTIYAAYLNYSLKSTYGGGSDGYIPVLGGAEINLSSLLYASARVGITFRTQGLGNAFTFSPGVGFKISRNFTALLKYVGQIRSAIN
jgi:hypothetical protein